MIKIEQYLSEKGQTLLEYLTSKGVQLAQIPNLSGDQAWFDLSGRFTNAQINQFMEEYNPWPLEKRNKWLEIQTEFRIAVDNLTQGTTDTERNSWTIQEAEARAFVVDPNTPTPALSILAQARGVPLNILVEKVIEKAELYKRAYFYYQGLRDRAEDRIKEFSDDLPLEKLTELRSIKYMPE